MPDRLDVFTAPVTFDPDGDPPGYRGAEARDVRALGRGGELTVRVFELPAGEALCPYHYEFVEEWLVVLAGELDLRTPDGTERLSAGAIARFPSGPDGAHKVTTPPDAARATRLMMFSSAHEPAVSVSPDSDKVGVWVPGGSANLMARRGTELGYYDGEA